MKLEEYAKLHHFAIHKKALFDVALTHPSYNMDAHTKHRDYERLEFIGDAVLGYVSADLIFKLRPGLSQGDMTKLRSNLVNSKSLASYARRVNIAELIIAGKSISSETVAKSDRILEDVFESLIGAIYLDNGIKVTYSYIESFLKKDIVKFKLDDLTDPKTKLQEELQAESRKTVSYRVVSESGPSHNKTFKVEVLFNDVVLASGVGKSKKEAEENAARNALNKRSV